MSLTTTLKTTLARWRTPSQIEEIANEGMTALDNPEEFHLSIAIEGSQITITVQKPDGTTWTKTIERDAS